MEGCHLGHNVRIGQHCTVTNMAGFAGHVEVGDYAVIGGLTGFHQFVRVGAYAMVGGLAKVIKDVPPYSLVDGHPARVHGINVVGLRRRGFSQEDRTKIKNIYKLLYNRHMPRTDAITEVEARYWDDEHGAVIIAFLRSLRRGITAWVDRDARRAGESG
jgi:UDP-N-acetylglucosamine acyltransferase